MLDLTVTRIVNVYHTDRQGWRRQLSAPRGYAALVFFTEGENCYLFGERRITARAGDLLLLPGDVPYAGTPHGNRVGYFVMDFECAPADVLAQLGAPLLFTPASPEELYGRFQQAVRLWQRQPVEVNLRLRALLYDVLGQCLSEPEATAGRLPTEALLQHIADHLADPQLSVETLCRKYYISESQLRRNLQKATGHTPKAYIRLLRMHKARAALAETDLPIKEIAAGCGFLSPYYFSRCFTEDTGLSPREYRRRHTGA